MRDSEKTIGNLIDKTTITQICYLDKEGYPVTRAMLAPRKREGIKTFWFTTNTSSNKVKCYKENPLGSIYFVDKRFFRGVNLVGKVEVLEDEETKRMIWHEGDEIYYPLGINDPDYTVLKFTAVKGRYYHNFKSEDFPIE